MIYFNLRGLEKTAVRATFAVNFLIDGSVRLVAYLVIGLPFAAAGLYVGGRIQTGFTQTNFVRVVSLLLVGSGLTLLLRR